ncbi:MAG TPA: hypothetical protein VN408_13915 [Actinoplanes sp.]|nr:hypothetical protein [Actinoplanes sp.]
MEPTPSPDNTRPSPGLSRFWQTLPEPEGPDPVETPADLLPVSPLGTFHSHPIPPLAPITSAARHPSGADPFGLNRTPAGSLRDPGAVPADTSRAGSEGDRDTDHSVPSDELPGPFQDVKSQGGRFPDGHGREQDEDPPGDARPDEPVDQDPPDSGRDAAETAEHSDENGRDDMNGRAGAPGYAQTGEAGPDGTGDAATEPQAEPARPAAGWASVPSQAQPVTPISGGPVSGVPVSPAYANPYSVADFTPDHPAVNLQQPDPIPATPPAAAPEEPAEQATGGTAVSPVSPAASAPPVGQASVQVPVARPPADPVVERTPEGFTPTGYSLGRTPEVYGVASVTPTPQPPAFPTALETSLTIDVPAARRSASLEDAEPARRAASTGNTGNGTGRRGTAIPAEGSAPAAPETDEPLIGRTVWDEDAARHFRAAWHEVKAEFVDDPVTALTRAHDLLTDAVNELTEVLLAERDELDPLRGTGTPDTESMRMAMRGYREYLERILSL